MLRDDGPSTSPRLEPSQAILQPDDPAAVESARRRLATRSRFRLATPLQKLRSKLRPPTKGPPSPDKGHYSSKDVVPSSSDETQSIILETLNFPELPQDQDAYRWAVLYENQRGLTMFSTPYYSSLSLLPADPAPFTVPSASTRRSRQQNVSLNNYPLPDGTWRWVSKAWMIDMRANLGEVQHDGFEYNWSFREKHWHAEVGPLSAGAWVRRRRWVRLMMRPAKCTSDRSGSSTNSPAQTTRTSPLTSTSSILLANSASDIALDSLEREAYRVWQGDPDEHWHRCRRLLVRLGSDGRKLELWRLWLAPHIHDGSEDPKGKGKQSNNDHSPPEAHTRCPPPLPTLSMLLRNHADIIIRTFVFPESRAQFLQLLRCAGLLDELEEAGSVSPRVLLDFWSYASGIDKAVDSLANDVNGGRSKEEI